MLQEKTVDSVVVRLIPSFAFFWVSDSGRVWSEGRVAFCKRGRKRHLKGKWLKPLKACPSGHMFYRLQEHGVSEKILLHRLVALAWIGPPPFAGAKVLHWDDNPKNNHVSNLRWGTQGDNIRDRFRNARARKLTQ